MIIFGSRGVTWTKESGLFACPGCGGSQQTYTRKVVRRFFTLYFIPLIPLDKIGEYLECQRCRNTYNEKVLTGYNPAEQEAKQKAEFLDHLKRIMILTALADGRADDEEVDAIREQYQQLSGKPLGGADLERELALARNARVSPADYARRFAGELNDRGKELVIRVAHAVLIASGGLGEDEQDLLRDLAEAMDITSAHLRGILAELEG